MDLHYKIYPLGDAAACIDLGNIIDEDINRKIIAIQSWLHSNPFEGLKDIVIAYASISVYYDPLITKKRTHFQSTVFEFIRQKLEAAFSNSTTIDENDKKVIRIPVCYSDEFAIDINFISSKKQISREEIIHLHTSKTYRVYMIGFLPGFSYLGQVDEKLIIPRKKKPITVAAGSVGIAGSQTGVYPLACPGGWQIIGRTPMKFFDSKATLPVMMNAGDHVQFYEISRDEFENHISTQKSKIEE
ncbi:MAG TPA: 5-oxoprolinase subunit PxpB [Puia sp.]|nr:5-oxoprolinase subunit PxpB [Puia sp.]